MHEGMYLDFFIICFAWRGLSSEGFFIHFCNGGMKRADAMNAAR